jgi:hypothetical protein
MLRRQRNLVEVIYERETHHAGVSDGRDIGHSIHMDRFPALAC